MNVSSLHLSGPTPKLIPSLAFLVFVKGVNIHSYLSLKSQCCSVTNMGWLLIQYPFLSSPIAHSIKISFGEPCSQLVFVMWFGKNLPCASPKWWALISQSQWACRSISQDWLRGPSYSVYGPLPHPNGQTLVQFGPDRVNAWLSYNGWRKKPLFCFEWGGM